MTYILIAYAGVYWAFSSFSCFSSTMPKSKEFLDTDSESGSDAEVRRCIRCYNDLFLYVALHILYMIDNFSLIYGVYRETDVHYLLRFLIVHICVAVAAKAEEEESRQEEVEGI